jgi:hypothetical protein
MEENQLNIPFKSLNVKYILLVDDPQPNSNRVYIKYRPDPQKGACDLNIQTPDMMIPFGLSDNREVNKGDDNIKRYIDMSFRGETDNPNVNKKAQNLVDFRKKMKEFDDRIIELLLEGRYMEKFCNSDIEWNKQSVSWALNKMIRVFRPSKASREKAKAEGSEPRKYPDTFRVPIPWTYDKNNKSDPGNVADYVLFWSEGNPRSKNPDEHPQRLTIDAVVKNCSAKALVRMQSLTFINNAVHYSKKLRQLQITPPRERLTGFQFQFDNDDEKENQDEDLVIEDQNEDLLIEEDAESVEDQNAKGGIEEDAESVEDQDGETFT